MNDILLKGGKVVDPVKGTVLRRDMIIREGRIHYPEEGESLSAKRVIDVEGAYVFPGLVDLHVHLRDFEQSYKETVETGLAAAARGGVTSLLAMPNTLPPRDSVDRVREVAEKAKGALPVRLYQASSITAGMKGEELVDMDALVAYGVKGFSEDGKSVLRSDLLFEAMNKAVANDVLILEHCEDPALLFGGVMNADVNAERLGLPGIMNAVEDTIAARDIVLAGQTGARLHLCHCSTGGTVYMTELAKKRKFNVTAEVCPHHFAMTSDEIPSDDAMYKMNPPLRTKRDAGALIEGLRTGIMDAISTDHAPHGSEEKKRGFLRSPFGIVGIETSAAVTYTYLVKRGVLDLPQMAARMSYAPARILGIDAGTVDEGAVADIAVFDLDNAYTVDPERFASKGHNTPFAGRTLYGRTLYTIVGGEVIMEGGIL